MQWGAYKIGERGVTTRNQPLNHLGGPWAQQLRGRAQQLRVRAPLLAPQHTLRSLWALMAGCLLSMPSLTRSLPPLPSSSKPLRLPRLLSFQAVVRPPGSALAGTSQQGAPGWQPFPCLCVRRSCLCGRRSLRSIGASPSGKATDRAPFPLLT